MDDELRKTMDKITTAASIAIPILLVLWTQLTDDERKNLKSNLEMGLPALILAAATAGSPYLQRIFKEVDEDLERLRK